jgi:hypothetical protein
MAMHAKPMMFGAKLFHQVADSHMLMPWDEMSLARPLWYLLKKRLSAL